MPEYTLRFDDTSLANTLFGPQNAHLELLAKESGTHISNRGTSLLIQGEDPETSYVQVLLSQLYGVLKSGGILHAEDFIQAYELIKKTTDVDLKQLFHNSALIISPRKKISPKTLNQRLYLEALRDVPMTFASGPAGTGKTYLAVAMAISMLISKKVKRIILTRPAVEAGEKLGFLPGDLAQKVNPYLRPLFDALNDMLGFEKVQELTELGTIEIAPLAFMRGRTLNNAFVILDEAQNTTIEQMKMFVTRMGFGSYMAITGDITQIDLPETSRGSRSGLVHALSVLSPVDGIRVVTFSDKDVIRHPLVAKIVKAYESN